ncbi:MAG: hypothetical protein HQL73_08525 [Magnetococcales bacterium]|nr:hypothetical protein [Magnetococcales bacterium]
MKKWHHDHRLVAKEVNDKGPNVIRRFIFFKYFWGAMILLATMGTPVLASGENNVVSADCSSFDFSAFKDGNKLKWPGIVRVLRHDAVLFADEKGSKRVGFLAFNQHAELLDANEHMLHIRTLRFHDQAEATGWVLKEDLLCGNLPSRGESGLEMKFFIKTENSIRPDATSPSDDTTSPMVQIYQDPELKDCVGGEGNCRGGASRFHMYFVFSQTNEAFLLADRFRLEKDDQLLGWVAKKDGFLWNNAFSVRPREDLVAPDGSSTGTICTYEQLKDAVDRNSKACLPVLGGRDWFKSALRIPVLDMVDQSDKPIAPEGVGTAAGQRRFFKVALARPGLVGRRVSDDKVAISTGLAQRLMPGVASLAAKKHVDIFFLLDATASMDPFIDAVRGTSAKPGIVQEVIHHLKKSQGFKDTEFRFGFRVYRDPYADKEFTGGPGDGIGEGHPLPAQCDLNESQQRVAFESFQKAIAKVRASGNDTDDDYEENLFGGLSQVLSVDLKPCPDNIKLLFIVGDAGYQTTRPAINDRGRVFQKAKYANPVTTQALASLMQRGVNGLGDNLVTFFIQTPSLASKARHSKAYTTAYVKFERQARELLEQTLPTDSKISDHLLRLDENGMIIKLVGTVEKLSSSALIDEIILDIHGGGALVNIIDRLRRERVDIPGLYWHILKTGACGQLGKQCQERVYDTTRIGFIEADDKVVEELWVTSTALASWIRILRTFNAYVDLPEAQLRRALGNALAVELRQNLRLPNPTSIGESPLEFVQRRGGLPVRNHSPLLSYNIGALLADKTMRDKNGRLIALSQDGSPLLDKEGNPLAAVPFCELRRLASWAINSRQMLEIIENDFNKPVFKVEPFRPGSCPDATENGKRIVQVDGPIHPEPLGNSKAYRYSNTFGGTLGYWIPQEYLP